MYIREDDFFDRYNFRENYNDVVLIGNTLFNIHIDYFLYDSKRVSKKGNKNIMHNHFFNEILFVKKGEVVLEVDGKKINVKSNSFVVLPLNVIHSTIITECEYYAVGIRMKKQKKEGRFGKTYDLFDKIFSTVSIYDKSAHIVDLLDRIVSGLSERRKLGVWLVRTYLQELVLLVGERILQNSFYTTSQKDQFVLPNLELAINQRINFVYEDVTLKDLAKEFFISERHLSRMIKEQYGVSFQKRKNIIRIERAKKFLIETNMSIEEISQRVFFSTISNFSNMFKKIVGCSPIEYRAKNLNK